MRILFLSRWFPYPSNNGTKLRVYNLLRGLASQHDIVLLSFEDEQTAKIDLDNVRAHCSYVDVVPWREYHPSSWRALWGVFNIKPRFLLDTYSPEMAEKISNILRSQKIDLVIASGLSMASYHYQYREIPAIFEEVELGAVYDGAHTGNVFARARRAFTWVKLRFYVSKLLESFRFATVASLRELNLLKEIVPLLANRISIFPNCVNVNEYNASESPKRETLVYFGSFRYRANYEAMIWFVNEIFPLILNQKPEAHLYITGDSDGLKFPAHRNITQTGHLQNIRDFVSTAWVSIVPLKSGGGTRLKVLESMALGVPVVSTSKGIEGIDAVPEKHYLAGNTKQEFANQVLRIIEDENLRRQLVENARLLVEQKYNWESTNPEFLHLIEKAIVN